MMTLKIKVYSDYVCPFCFLGKQPLDRAIAGKDIEVEWMPFELRPFPNETHRPESEYIQKSWQQSVLPMAKALGVEMTLPGISPMPYTHLAFEGYQFAKEHGKGNEYHEQVFRAYFQKGQDIGDVTVLTQLAGEIGLNEQDYRTALEFRTYQKAHQAALNHAYQEAQINVVPTFIIGNRVLRGVPNQLVLERFIDEEFAKGASNAGEGASCGLNNC